MDKRDAEEIVSSVLDSLIEFASGGDRKSGNNGNAYDEPSSVASCLDLSGYMSRCIVNISEESSIVKEAGEGDGKYLVPEGESSFDDIAFPFTENHPDWQDVLDSNESYITHWNFYPVSSEDLLNLKPNEMCESWDEDEDKRRMVYWGNRGLMQERYIRTLFREMDVPDEARPTLNRVSSEEFPSGAVPHVTALVASRRLPSGVSIGALPVTRKRTKIYDENDENQNTVERKKTLLKGWKRFVYKKFLKRFRSKISNKEIEIASS